MYVCVYVCCCEHGWGLWIVVCACMFVCMYVCVCVFVNLCNLCFSSEEITYAAEALPQIEVCMRCSVARALQFDGGICTPCCCFAGDRVGPRAYKHI